MAGIHFEIDGTNEGLIRKLRESRQAILDSGRTAEQQGNKINQSFEGATKGASGLNSMLLKIGGTAALTKLVSDVIRVRGEFQQLDVAFTTLLQSKEKANALMAQMVETAAKTPFNLTELATGARQLVAYGFASEEVNGTLIRLGNVAAGLGLPLERLTYLYGTTMTQGRLYTRDMMQFTTSGIPMLQELADMYGVSTAKINEMVTAGKIGFPEVQKAIENMTNEGGKFFNLMEEQSKTITGKISNLGDAMDMMFNSIGQANEGVINDSIDGLKYLVENYETVGLTIMELVAVYGTYKAILMSVAAYQSMAVGVTYAAEIAELSKLIPLKQQSANQDIIAAVNSGKLTQAKAEQVIALRAEIAAKIQSLQATEAQTKVEYASAMASYKVATQRMLLAKQNMAIAQSQMSIAIKSGTADEIAAAKKNAQTASLELNNAAIAKNTTHKSLNTAATNRKSASETLNTLETGKNSVAQTVNTASTNILTAAKTKLAAASKALGLSMLANPYVLVAAAAVGLGYAIYKVVTAENELDKAHKRLNNATSDVEKNLSSEVSKLTSLERKLAETKKGTEEYSNIKKAIVDNYGLYYKGLDGEIERVGNLSTVYGRLVEAMRLSIGQRKFESFFKAEQDNLDKTIGEKLDTAYETLIDKYGKTKGGNLYNQFFDSTMHGEPLAPSVIKDLQNATFMDIKLGSNAKDGLIDFRNSVFDLRTEISKETKATEEVLDEYKSKFKITEEEVAKIPAGDSASTDKQPEENKTLRQLLLDIDTSKSKIKELQEQANKGLISSDKIKEEQDALAKLTSDYKNRTGKEYGSTKESTQAANTAESLREQQEKYNLLLDKQKLDRQRQTEDLESQLAQSNVDAMTDGFDKEQAQRDLNNKKEIQSLERQKEDYIRAIIQAEKDKFDAQEDINAKQKKGYVKQTFDTSTVSVDASVFDGIINNTSKKQLNDKVREQEDAWDEYIIKYGAFTQKKEAIDRKYKKLIDEAPDAGIAATLQREWEEATANLDLSKLKQDMNWEMIFGDLSKVTKDQLKNIKKQLSEFKKSPEFQNATPEQIQVIEGAINSINNAMVDKGGFFGGMVNSVTELRLATEELKKAEEELAEANKKGTEAQKEEAQKKVNQVKNKQQNAETNVTKSSDKTIQHLTSVGDAIAQLGSSAEMSLSSFGNATGGIVDAFTEAGSKIGGLVGAVFSILDGIQQQGFGKFAGNILESVAGAALNVATFGLVKIGADYSHYNEMKEEYDELNEIWDELIDKKMEYIDISYGIEASKVGKEAEAIQQKAIDGYRTLGLERLNSGASAGSHSIGVRINNGMSSEGWEQAKTALGTTFDDLAIGDGRMTGMFDLTAKQLEKLKEEAPIFWAKLDDDVKGYLNKIIEGEDKIDEIQEKVKEQLTQTSFDNVFDSFMDTLMDMDSAAQDFAGDFEEYMKRAVLMNVMGPKLQKQLETWYENFSKDMDEKREKGKFLRPGKVIEEAGILTDEELKNRKEEWDKIVQDGIAERDALFAAMGFDSDPTREASKKGIATASQDSVDENNGRLTVIQGHTYSINEGVRMIQSYTEKMAGSMVNLTSLADVDKNMKSMLEMRSIAIGHLSNIEKNTARLEAIENTMVSMNRGIQDMNTKGLTFRR